MPLATFLVAARNLTRNRRRGVIALATIVSAVVAMILADGFSQWIFWAMREGTIQSQLGHIEVVRPGYFDRGAADPFSYVLPPQAQALELRAIESTPGVKVVAPRVKVTGLVSHGDTTVSFIGDGVDPGSEAELSKAFRIVAGNNLSGPQAREVTIGRGLAHELGIAPGDTVALLASTRSGGVNAIEARVSGIFISGSQTYDDTALRLPIGLAQSLLRISGAHVWLVLLENTDDTDRLLRDMRSRFPSSRTRLEFVPWYERADFYNKTVALFSSQINVLKTIIAIIIVLSISNMLAMNVLERTGEIGTALALGFSRGNVLQQFATEGVLLGLFGAAAGVAIGCGLAGIISTIGIPMPPPPGMEEGYTGRILMTGGVVASGFAIAFLTTATAGLYPAWRASRLNIVDALRHNV